MQLRLRRLLTLDGLGVLASTLCLVHCLALPLLAGALPFVLQGSSDAHHHHHHHGHEHAAGISLHIVLFLAIAPIALIALGRGYLHHRRGAIPLLGACGLALLGLGMSVGGPLEIALSVVGSIGLAAAHLWNHKSLPCYASGVHVAHA